MISCLGSGGLREENAYGSRVPAGVGLAMPMAWHVYHSM